MNFYDPAAFFNLEVRPTARSKRHDALAQGGDGAHGFLYPLKESESLT